MTVTEFNTCVDQYADSVYRFIVKNIRDTDKARDIVQDTFEKVWLKVAELDVAKVKSYLFTTAYNTMIDLIRREKFQGDFDQIDEIHYVSQNGFSDLKTVLNEALGKLPEVQRLVIVLRDYEGYSYEEIGEITGLNESQVKVYIYRARVFLKEYIGSLDTVL
ncbi:MAG: RNA polymerase sigma factor [Bacteroidota bacterium]